MVLALTLLIYNENNLDTTNWYHVLSFDTKQNQAAGEYLCFQLS